MRVPLVLGVIVGSLLGQLPESWQQRLHSKDAGVREAAVKELGTLDPTPSMSAEMLAAGLVIALKDEELTIRDRAAKFLGGNRPSNIAVPGLLQALRAVDKDFEWAGKVLAGLEEAKKPPPGHSRVMDGFTVLMLLPYSGTILFSLRDHQDERAVTGLAEILAGWKLDRIPGAVIQESCKELCLRGTAPALDAVVELLMRGKRILDGRPIGSAPDTRTMKPAEELRYMYRSLTPDQVKAIVADLDSAVGKAGIEIPSGFDRTSPLAWKDLLKVNATRIPKRLADRSASKPASRPGSEK